MKKSCGSIWLKPKYFYKNYCKYIVKTYIIFEEYAKIIYKRRGEKMEELDLKEFGTEN